MIVSTLLQRADFFDRDWNLWVIIGILVFYLSLSRANPGINMSVREYGVYQAFSVPFFILIGITGSMLCIWGGKAFQNCIVGTVLAYIGQNTIVLLALHILGLEIFEMAAAKFINIGELTGVSFILYHTVRVTASVCGCLCWKILDGISGHCTESTEGKYMEKTVKKGRNSSIEMLRIVCLVMIFWMHAADSGVANGIGAWIDIAVAVIGNISVSCFILISGYYGIRLDVKKMMHLECMLLFYSWTGLLFQYVWGNALGGEEVLSYLLPVIGKRSWYFTCYFALAFLSPFLNEMVEKLSEAHFRQFDYDACNFFGEFDIFLLARHQLGRRKRNHPDGDAVSDRPLHRRVPRRQTVQYGKACRLVCTSGRGKFLPERSAVRGDGNGAEPFCKGQYAVYHF